MIGVAVLAVALVVVAVLAPHPSVLQVREWAQSVGPAFPLVFFAVHALVTVFPFPRTVFTLSAGLLFGAGLGIAIAVLASTVSAVLALSLVRAVGRDVVWQRISNPTIRRVDERIARRGWIAVGSLRLIAFVPFSVVNYCAGVSSIRLVPYVLATVVGILPGTVGIVVLGDAFTGETNPALLGLSAVCIVVGIAGLVVDSRRPLDGSAGSVADSSADRPVEDESIPQP
ncbi:TVP38/TMEM64 family protein [Rhodococcus wratislaviensis]|nr:TVP38/TMEM64 family protein [Rhodococcus sp. 3A]MBC2891138.1 TVP38/TMEM64 family protein [Rhodococcus sp. 4CII]